MYLTAVCPAVQEWYFEAAHTLSEADGTLLAGLDRSKELSENVPRGQNVRVPTFVSFLCYWYLYEY